MADPDDLEAGRYLYCVVRTNDDGAATFDTEGIEDEPVRVVTAGDLGAAVHDCEALYDSDDPTTLKRWLLAHQRVADAAAEAFGTPLPVRFDTVLAGDDDDVRAWLRESADELRESLDELAGHREYRIDVSRDEDAVADRLAGEDARLRELRERSERVGEGASHLVDKQYEQRLTELVREDRNRLAGQLRERLAEHAAEVRRLGRNRRVRLLGAGAEEGSGSIRFAVLASVDEEDEIGAVLDEVAAEEGTEVRFSGPWPPYTFAPELDAVEGDAR